MNGGIAQAERVRMAMLAEPSATMTRDQFLARIEQWDSEADDLRRDVLAFNVRHDIGPVGSIADRAARTWGLL
jgi:hypothetical protein